MIGINELPLLATALSRTAKASFKRGSNPGSNIELSLVLDFTGSIATTVRGRA